MSGAEGTERDDGGGLEPGRLGVHACQALRRQQHQEVAEAAVAHRAVVLCAQGPGQQQVRFSGHQPDGARTLRSYPAGWLVHAGFLNQVYSIMPRMVHSRRMRDERAEQYWDRNGPILT